MLKPYRIIQANQSSALEIMVEALVLEGYGPLGGVAVYWDSNTQQAQYCQAMYLRQLAEPDLE